MTADHYVPLISFLVMVKHLVEAMEDVHSKCSSMDKSTLSIVPVDLDGGLSDCKFTITMVS